MSKRDLYQGKYFIAFYDKTGDQILHMFDNIREICEYQKKEPTRTYLNQLNVMLYRALKTDTRFVTFLTGKVMKVYIFQAN